MTSRDRTAEFSNAVRSAASRGAAPQKVARAPNRVAQGHAEFMFIARAVGKNIAATYTKLEKLTVLAKKRSLFSDRPEEIQELTYIIKEDLSSLNQQIAKLQEVARTQRESREPRGKQLVSHTTSVVFALQSRLASMSNAFKGVLEVRSENLREQKQRRDRFGGAAVSSAPPPGAFGAGGHGDGARLRSVGSVLFRDESAAVEMEPLLGRQAQSQAMVSYDQTDDYLSSRADTMQSIESTIVELGGIFTQLATMVKEQEEMVERIDSNVADTELNVEAAHGEILKYFQSVTSNRWLMIKVFAVLIFFFIFFVVFLA